MSRQRNLKYHPAKKCKQINHNNHHNSKRYYKDPKQMQETYAAAAPQPKIQGAKQQWVDLSNDCVK